MASSGERRMVFDTRGRRKHVIRVVYAILALLMAGSLFLVVGPVNIGALLGNQTSTGNAAKGFEEEAERIEGRLAKHPTDEGMLLSLTRARVGVANAKVEIDPTTKARTVPPEASADYEAALEAWNAYLKQAGSEPSVSTAQLIAATYFGLAESGSSLSGVEAEVATATAAQQIVAEQRPSLGSIGTLAKFQYYSGEFAAGDKSAKQAAAKAPSKAEAKNVEKTLVEYRKQAEKFAQQKKQIKKAEKKAGKEKLANPFGIGGGTVGE
jgi:hypothetical protein